MFIFFLQLRDTLHGGRLYVFSILVALTWVLWAIKLRLSRRYTPWVGEHETTASVVIPVVDEPVGLFHEVLDHITEQTPHQVTSASSTTAKSARSIGVRQGGAPTAQSTSVTLPHERHTR